MSPRIEQLNAGLGDVAASLLQRGDLSLVTLVDDVARKTLLISAASYFEIYLTRAVGDFASDSAGTNTLIPSIIAAKAIARQYHTWFSWDAGNANSFFSLFGSDFKAFMRDRINNNENLSGEIAAFMEIGRERNKLAHGDYAVYTVEKTAAEIFELYRSALRFVQDVPQALRDCAATLARPAEG